MKNKLILLVFGLVFIASKADAQKKLNLTLKFDKEFERYEVFVKPNFSEKNFTWGPSQISLVIPSNVLVDKIIVKNVDGGSWEDNSIVIAPEVAPDKAFHGISSGGNKTNLTEDYESVLFYFTLPKQINPDLVRIYENETDPKSSAKGMMGGDFSNMIVDLTGKDWFKEVYNKKEAPSSEKPEEVSNIEALVYPNVITDNKFKVSLKGLSNEDGDVLMIAYDVSGREILRARGPKETLEQKVFSFSKSLQVENLFVKWITSKGSVGKRVIVEN
ncbi:MAG: hypothetical protein ACOVNP_05620 [Flavobacterium sp.]